MVGGRDCYEILQVHPSAEPEVIESAYRRLARKYHPDLGGSTERMAELNAAYEVLRDPVKRAEYEAARSAGSAPAQNTTVENPPPSASDAPRIPSKHPIVRWLLVLPAAAAGTWAAGRVFAYFVETFGPEQPFSFLQRVLVVGAAAAMISAAGILSAVATAPNHRRAAATFIGALYVLLGGFLMFPAVENADWWNVFALLVWAAAAIITAVAVRDAVDGSR